MATITINKSELKDTTLENNIKNVFSKHNQELVFPKKNLGLIKEFSREDLYEEYLSNRL